jgi:WD40 repeat protein
MPSVDWSRDGHLLVIDGKQVQILSAEGKPEGVVQLPGDPSSAGIVGEKGEHFVVKIDELWHLYRRDGDKILEIAQTEENFEMESFAAASTDGKWWAAKTSDTGATIYDLEGRAVAKFPDAWGPEVAFAEDGSAVIATIDESVTVRLPDGTLKELSPAGEISRRNTTGITVKWVGSRLYVRSIHSLRSWDMRAAEVENAGTEVGFEGDRVSIGMDAGENWAAVSFSDGQIALYQVDEMVEVDRLVGHVGMISDLRFGQGDRLTSIGEDGTLRIWFPSTGIRINAEKPVYLERDNRDLWTAGEEAELANDPAPAAPGRPYGTRSQVVSPDGRRAMTTGDDGLVRIWNPDGPELLLSLKSCARRGLQIAVSKDGRSIAGQFMTPGEDLSYDQTWSAQPWTRKALGIGAEDDWRKAYETERLKRFKIKWAQP